MSPGKLVHHGKLLRLCLLQRIQKCCNSLPLLSHILYSHFIALIIRRFGADFPFLRCSSLFSWSFFHNGAGWSTILASSIIRFRFNLGGTFASDARFSYMIEGCYVATSKNFIDLIVVDGFPEASSRLDFVPIFCILVSFYDILHFPNAFVGGLVSS